MYDYKAKATKVIDGDTVQLVVSLGFYLTTEQRFRLVGIDTPELKGETLESGRKAKDFVTKALITDAPLEIYIVTQKSDSFGRWLADIYYKPTIEATFIHLNQQLLDLGLAKPYSA